MEVIAFSASPRNAGNTEYLLDRIIEGLREGGASVEKIRTHELDIFPCTGCGFCEQEGKCCFEDDFSRISERLIACDGVVFASPLYFMNTPAKAKALIDRCQSFWVARHRLGIDLFGSRRRFGILVACSGKQYGPGGANIFRGIEDTATYFFDALGLEKLTSFLVRKVDSPRAIREKPDVLKRAKQYGKEIARFS